MALLLSSSVALWLSAASISPATVPASGEQEAFLSLDAPATVHLSAHSASGTACTVVDRVRGPFINSGSVDGHSNCELDLMLDAGRYKVRLESAPRGKGVVTLTVKPFEEINGTPVKLEGGRLVTTVLKPGQQASYWLALDTRRTPYVRVSGRNAGDVRLWRNGEWMEPLELKHHEFSPMPGQPMHEWWLDTALSKGDYVLRVYGKNPTTVTGSSTDDSLTVEADFQPGPPERTRRFSLGPSGVEAVELPGKGLGVLLSLDGRPRAQTSVEVYALHEDSALNSPLRCFIEPKGDRTECSAVAYADSPRAFTRHVALVRGPPMTQGTLSWAPSEMVDLADGGEEWSASSSNVTPLNGLKAGRYLIGSSDLPYDLDAPPLSCELAQYDEKGETTGLLQGSALSIGEKELLDRSFNYNGNSTTVRFEVASVNRVTEAFRGRTFLIQTTGERKNSCVVYRLKGTTAEAVSKPVDGNTCKQQLSLSPGLYAVTLNGGSSGIEHLVIKEAGTFTPRPITAKGGCLLPQVDVSSRQLDLRFNRSASLRGVAVVPLPWTASSPFTITLDSKGKLPVPLKAGPAFVVRSGGGNPFQCALGTLSMASSRSECQVPARTGDDVLTVENTTDDPMTLTFFRPSAVPPRPSLQAWRPDLKALPVLTPGAIKNFDFGPRESHEVAFDVDKPGLYHATTLGLLSTLCRLRTPTVPRVAENSGGGRGRNCLVAEYLQPGRYMFTAETTGDSRGRAGLVLTRQGPQEFAQVMADSEAYFRVAADQLAQQRLTVRATADYELATNGQGQSLTCRLDDAEGWPVDPVPTSCTGVRTMTAGTYLWTQRPLTVESMRRTTLKAVRPAVVLRGNKPHALEFFTWYTAELGPDGKDEFTFSLEGQTQLDVVLTQGMQGRVYRLEADKPPKAVEIIAPQGGGPESGQEGSGEQFMNEAEESEAIAAHHAYQDEHSCEEGGCEQAPEPPPQLVAAAVPPPPAGARLNLPAGRYKIVAEHSKGDVGLTYQLHLGTSVLAPGMTRTVPAPSSMEVLVPRDGTLRLKTEGVADVRCRLFDAQHRLVFENGDNGPDWNCAVAEPITKGRYLLVIESETQQPGQTTVSLSLPTSDDKGTITNGGTVKLSGPVVSFSVPVAETDAVQEITFSARSPISCALEGPQGQVVGRQSRTTSCGFLVRPKLEKYRVRLWTTDGNAQATTTYRSRPVQKSGGGSVPSARATLVSIGNTGRFHTSGKVFCLAGGSTGPLSPCGPEVSLEKGEVVFSSFGEAEAALPLDEVRVATSDGTAVPLTRNPFLQRATADGPSIFLLSVGVRHGERAAPSCAFDGPGTARERRDDQCFAASALGLEATARLWAASDDEVQATVMRRVVPMPRSVELLASGHRALQFSGGVGAWALPPSGRARLEITLPGAAWAVLLDDAGKAVDLCAPSDELRRCVVTGQGGKVVLVSASGQADVTTLMLDAAPRSIAFTGLFEDVMRVPGTVKLNVAPRATEQVVQVEGALRCTMDLSDGARHAGCRTLVPANLSGELFVEHGVGPVRALTSAVGGERWAKLGIKPGLMAGPRLDMAVATPLSHAALDRTMTVQKESAVRVSAESGVCGLLRGDDLLGVDGLGGGCELVRVLSPGIYRLIARPFAGQVVPGTVRWTAEPVTTLAEGIGPESWVAAGDVRLFRFTTTAKGRIGLGVQVKSDALECTVLDDSYKVLGEGCQQYLAADKGTYLLTVKNPPRPGAPPLAFKPVLLGLSGERLDVPQDFLKNFFERVGVR